MNLRSPARLSVLLLLSFVAARAGAQVPALPRCDSIMQQQPANVCNGKAASVSDARLHLLLQELDKTLPTPQLQKLHESQTHWAQYRDEQCALEYTVAEGGTLAPSLGARCAVRLTEARILELKLFLCPGEGLTGSPCAAARRYDLPQQSR
ncbi:MAG: lysozyme inhibitor LprI family protein [Gemmatimonadaceae bacterium]